MSFVPSSFQLDIFTELRSGTSNLIIEAGAGCGKTTTIVEGLKCLPVRLGLLPPAVVFLAFNKSIAETLQARVPRHVSCSTFHSLGFRALKNSGLVSQKVKVEGRKCPKLVWNAMDRDDLDVQNVIKLVSLAKGQATSSAAGDVDVDFLEKLAERFDLQVEDAYAFRVAREVFRKSAEDRDTIDFDDMLYLPVALGATFAKQDFIFVDEAQDTNDIQVEILDRLRKPAAFSDPPDAKHPTRLIAVGDPFQAIYGFRGANSDAMPRIKARFACKTLPLSVSYRCPQKVVLEAQKYLSQPIQ